MKTKLIDLGCWATGLALVGVAVGRALTAPVPPDAAPMPAGVADEAYRFVASEETVMREKAMANFLADPWSQDDDFHASERGRAFDFAASHKVRRSDVLRAIDDGLRSGWPLPNGVRPRATVPPCRPRPL